MIEVEFFPKVNNRSEHSPQGLDSILKWSTTNVELKLNTDSYKQWIDEHPNATKTEKSKMKVKHFSVVSFGGTFTGTGRAVDIKNMSGLIVLDFDHIKNLTDVKTKLKSDPHTFLLFVSPSGDGLKAVVKHNLTDPEKWKYLYHELEAYYLQLFMLETDINGKQLAADSSGKDISRMCFMPYIDDLFRNDDSVVWQYTGEYEKQSKTLIPRDDLTPSTTEITDDLYKECYFISAYLFQHHIDISNNYQDWLSYGYSLCVLGEQGRDIFHNISCLNYKYDVDNCNEQYDYMLTNFDKNRTDIKNYLNNGKKAIAEYSVFMQYGFICQ